MQSGVTFTPGAKARPKPRQGSGVSFDPAVAAATPRPAAVRRQPQGRTNIDPYGASGRGWAQQGSASPYGGSGGRRPPARPGPQEPIRPSAGQFYAAPGTPRQGSGNPLAGAAAAVAGAGAAVSNWWSEGKKNATGNVIERRGDTAASAPPAPGAQTAAGERPAFTWRGSADIVHEQQGRGRALASRAAAAKPPAAASPAAPAQQGTSNAGARTSAPPPPVAPQTPRTETPGASNSWNAFTAPDTGIDWKQDPETQLNLGVSPLNLSELNVYGAQHQLKGQGAAADWQNEVINQAAAAGQFGKTLRAKGPDGKDFTFRLDGKPEQWEGINSEEARQQRMLQAFTGGGGVSQPTAVVANTEPNAPVTAPVPVAGGSTTAPVAAIGGDQGGELAELRRQAAFLHAPDSQSGRQAVARHLANQAGLGPEENLNRYSIGQLEQKARDAQAAPAHAPAEQLAAPGTGFQTMQPLTGPLQGSGDSMNATVANWFQDFSRGLGDAQRVDGGYNRPLDTSKLQFSLNTKFDGVNPEIAQAAFAAQGLPAQLDEGTAAIVASGAGYEVIGGRNGRGTGRREAPLGFRDPSALPPLNVNVSAPTMAGAPGASPWDDGLTPEQRLRMWGQR